MKKMGSFVWFPCFLPELCSLNCPKRCIFYNFVLTSAKKPFLLKQITYIHLKVLITLFQKMQWFIGVWAIVHEILAIKISKKILTQQKCNKILWLQTLISPAAIVESFIHFFFVAVLSPLPSIFSALLEDSKKVSLQRGFARYLLAISSVCAASRNFYDLRLSRVLAQRV